MLSKISPENLKREEESLTDICKCLDKRDSLIFNAGAGAGKTYALIESLKYLVKIYNKQLANHHQKVICITYTNVATDEVKERLGNSNMVVVSTIHERIWELIGKYQKELVQIHKEKLEEEVKIFKQRMETEDRYQRYRDLNTSEQEEFKNIMLEHKALFSKHYSDSAPEFKDAFKNLLTGFKDIIRNVSNFKSIVSAIYKINNYGNCLHAIRQKEYSTIEYTSFYNTDQLHKMRISHDTLLEYGLKIIKQYDLLKQIIIDKYPFVFIDEYQDTDEHVVNIMSILHEYASKQSRNFFVGYFGDTAQSIYEKGVGKKITEIHKDLVMINKEFNRRSSKEVIDVANKIRDDVIIQTSIYEDCEGGSVKFYTGNVEHTNDFIEDYSEKWEATIENPLHCFVLTNRTVAQYTGFEMLYNVFSRTEIYSGLGYKQLNSELMSKDLSKLGQIPLLIFRIVSLINYVKNSDTLLKNIMPQRIYEGMNITDLKNLKRLLDKINGKTLKECIESILEIYSNDAQCKYRQIVHLFFNMENITLGAFKNFLFEKLFPNAYDENLEGENSLIEELLDINMTIYTAWQDYIMDTVKAKVIYHTYHGTKGLEFDNVVIIMGHAFGTNTNYFSGYFQGSANDDALKEARNLLYVSITRAIKNLRIYYIDNVANLKDGIERLFGGIHTYPPDKNDIS